MIILGFMSFTNKILFNNDTKILQYPFIVKFKQLKYLTEVWFKKKQG